MRNMRPLFRVLLLLTLSGVGSFSYAATLYSPANVTSYRTNNGEFSTPAAACASLKLASGNHFTAGPTLTSSTVCSYSWHANTGTAGGNGTYTIISSVVCPAGYTRDTAKPATDPQACYYVEPPQPEECTNQQGKEVTLKLLCGRVTCTIPWVRVDGNTNCSGDYVYADQPIPSPITQGTCQATFTRFLDNLSYNSDPAPEGTIDAYCNVVYTYNGLAAGSSTPPPTGSDTPASGGSVNGNTTPTPGSSPTNGSGTEGTGPTTTGNASGPGSDGSGIGTETNPLNGTGVGQDGETPCDPATQSCGSSYGSGTCESKPTCTGDPILCGIIQQNWVDTCALMKTPTTEEKETVDGQAKIYQTDYNQRTAQYGAKVGSFLAGFQGEATGTQYQGACPQDKSFQAMGRTFTLQLSTYCDHFRIFRFFILASAYLAAARIVFSGL